MSNFSVSKLAKTTGQIICQDIGLVGSGFFVSSQGLIITNNHVVSRISIDSTGVIRVDYSEKIYFKIGDKVYATSLVIDKDSDRPVVYDYAILKKTDASSVDYLDVSDVSDISQGQNVIAAGYPLDFNELIVSSGVISAIISRPSHRNALIKMRTFLMDTFITYGNSGGPLLRPSDGKVIGINTMPHTIRDELRLRLLEYSRRPEIVAMPVINDLIGFVLKYINIGFNYAVSIEYAMRDPVLEL